MFLNWKQTPLGWHARVSYDTRGEPKSYLDARVHDGNHLTLHAHSQSGERLPNPVGPRTDMIAFPPVPQPYDNGPQAMMAFENMIDELAISHNVYEEEL